MNKKNQNIIWIAVLMAGLALTGFFGFRIYLHSFRNEWELKCQQVSLRLNTSLSSNREKLLMFQKEMDRYLQSHPKAIRLPLNIAEKRIRYIYRDRTTDSMFILSPVELMKDQLNSMKLVLQEMYPYTRLLTGGSVNVARLYLRLKSGQVLEYYNGKALEDSLIISGFNNTPERMAPIRGKQGEVDLTRDFFGQVIKQKILTFYTALVLNDTVIGEICIDYRMEYFRKVLDIDLDKARLSLYDTTGYIFSTSDERLNGFHEVKNIYSFIPELKLSEEFRNSQNTGFITASMEGRYYKYFYRIGKVILAMYAKKTDVWMSIFLGLLPFFIVFIALWTASLAYYKQRQTTLKLRLLSAELDAARKEADSANQAKSVFLANMSHEIRTPMNAIIGFSQILTGLVRDPVQANYIKSISSSSKILLSLINDILDLSKIEAGKLEIHPEPFNIRHLLSEVGSLFIAKATEKGLVLTISVDENLPGNLVSDELRIRQILLNFMSNALKFTDEGEITLSAGLLARKGNRVDMILSVKDSGIGINQDQMKHVFGAFEQVENQDSRKYGGTGLGLAITQKLVTLMGGRVEVESEPFIGSTFSVTLPLLEVFEGDLNAPSVKMDQHSKVKFNDSSVLIVDDISNNRLVLSGLMSGLGLNCSEASNGKEALEMIRRAKPSLVMMDLRMPVMDGFAAVKEIRADVSLSGLPVIAVSASAFHQDERDVKLKGFDSFLKKPVIADELIVELCKFLPYENIQPEDGTPQAAGVPDHTVSAQVLNALLAELSGEFRDNVSAALKKRSVQFSKTLLEKAHLLVKKYSWEPFSKWVASLDLAIESFDIALMETVLKEFEPMLRKAKDVLSGMNNN